LVIALVRGDSPGPEGADHRGSGEQESGARTEELCRRHGISTITFYKWKARYDGLDVSEARRLKTLEDENRRLKKLLAEAVLGVAALKDLLAKLCIVRPALQG
jgi:putative transposase